METDLPEDPGKGSGLADDRFGAGELAPSDLAQVAGDVDPGGAGIHTGCEPYAVLPWILELESQRTGRANLDTAQAETASGVLEGRCFRPHDRGSGLIEDESQGIDVANLPAHPHAAQATDAEVVIAEEERFVVDNREFRGSIAGRVVGNADELGDLAKLADVEDRATAFLLRHVGRAGLQGATGSLRALDTGVRVGGEELLELGLPPRDDLAA